MKISNIFKLILVNSFVIVAILLAAELAAHLLLKFRDGDNFSLVTLSHRMRQFFSKEKEPECFINGDCPELKELKRSSAKEKYLWTIFNPHRHPPNETFWFGHPPDSTIVFCEEDDGLISFNSNSYGFREVKNEDLRKPVDAIFIGDSFTEGSCVPGGASLPDYVSELHNWNVLNFGVGSSGPLYQYAIFSEILDNPEIKSSLVDNAKVYWVVFTGNDLWNLRDEKITSLSLYLNDGHSQDYFSRLGETANDRKKYLNDLQNLYLRHGPPGRNLPPWRLGGAGLASVGAVSAELENWSLVYNAFLKKAEQNNLELILISLENHPRFYRQFMSALEGRIKSECEQAMHQCIQVDLSKVPELLTVNGGHFSPAGYKYLAEKISE